MSGPSISSNDLDLIKSVEEAASVQIYQYRNAQDNKKRINRSIGAGLINVIYLWPIRDYR
jgi:hypothetical protein